eukprot:5706617-Prymnesium_polylepis.1
MGVTNCTAESRAVSRYTVSDVSPGLCALRGVECTQVRRPVPHPRQCQSTGLALLRQQRALG